MASVRDLKIRKNRSNTISISVTGVDNWNDIIAKLYVGSRQSIEPILVIDGDIDSVNNIIVVEFTPTNTQDLVKMYDYEVVIYRADLSYAKTVVYGKLHVDPVVKEFTVSP